MTLGHSVAALPQACTHRGRCPSWNVHYPSLNYLPSHSYIASAAWKLLSCGWIPGCSSSIWQMDSYMTGNHHGKFPCQCNQPPMCLATMGTFHMFLLIKHFQSSMWSSHIRKPLHCYTWIWPQPPCTFSCRPRRKPRCRRNSDARAPSKRGCQESDRRLTVGTALWLLMGDSSGFWSNHSPNTGSCFSSQTQTGINNEIIFSSLSACKNTHGELAVYLLTRRDIKVQGSPCSGHPEFPQEVLWKSRSFPKKSLLVRFLNISQLSVFCITSVKMYLKYRYH